MLVHRSAGPIHRITATVTIAAVAAAMAMGAVAILAASATTASAAVTIDGPNPLLLGATTVVISGQSDTATEVSLSSPLSVDGSCATVPVEASQWSCAMTFSASGASTLTVTNAADPLDYATVNIEVALTPTIDATTPGVIYGLDTTVDSAVLLDPVDTSGPEPDWLSSSTSTLSTSTLSTVNESTLAKPTMTYNLGPASIVATASGEPNASMYVELYSVKVVEGEGYIYETPFATCPDGLDGPGPGGSSVQKCTFTNLAPGIWNVYSTQWVDGNYSDYQDDYILIPESPTLSATVNADRSVRLAGLGTAGFRVRAYDADGAQQCSVIVASNGEWSCVVNPGTGSHTFNAVQQSQGFVADTGSPYDSGDDSFDGFSARSATTTATVAAPTNTNPNSEPSPEPSAPIEYEVLVTDTFGNDVRGGTVRPGDTVFVSASGLPADADVVVELHSVIRTLGTGRADAAGDFALQVTIPSDVELGEHNIVLVVQGSTGENSTSRAPLTLANDTSATPQPDPAVDGQPIGDSQPGGAAGETSDPQSPGLTDPSVLGSSLRTIASIEFSLKTATTAASFAAVFVILGALPAELLQATLTSNYHRAFRWLRPVTTKVSRFNRWLAHLFTHQWVGIATGVTLTSLILSFAEPSFGFNGASVRVFLAILTSLALLNVLVNGVVKTVAERRFTLASTLLPTPAAILIALATVLVSRLADLEPGLLFGLVVGVFFAHGLKDKIQGQLTLVAVGTLLTLGVIAWAGYSALSAAQPEQPGFWYLLAQEVSAGTTLAALLAPLVMLLPVDFLDGKALIRWSRRWWAGAYAVSAATFAIVAIPVAKATQSAASPVLSWAIAFSVFTIAVLALWTAFKVIPDSQHSESAA